eukprot:1144640-Pelagomonas_calceolata.AAC.3
MSVVPPGTASPCQEGSGFNNLPVPLAMLPPLVKLYIKYAHNSHPVPLTNIPDQNDNLAIRAVILSALRGQSLSLLARPTPTEAKRKNLG